MNIHKINSHLHHSFLEEERKDAITGDLIQANDEVVFCATCKSAFFKDSWEYMDRKHCGQTKTLHSVPVSKPLLLNVSRIVPHFITLVNTSISFEKCLKMLSNFNPRDKKVEIRLDPILKQGTEQYKNLLEKANEIIEKDTTAIKESTHQINKSRNYISAIPISLFLGFALSFFPAQGFDSFWNRILFIFIVILSVYCSIIIFSFLRPKTKIIKGIMKEKSIDLLENSDSESKNSITFGIFNHSLFFYFEHIQQGIFIELSRISEIEIQYQSSCCVNLILKKQGKEVNIPLVFSKKERITTFLIRLAKTKKDIANRIEVKLTNFPVERIRLLKRKLLLYADFTFIEPEKIESKQPEYRKIFSLQDNTVINSINQEINSQDLSKLEKSQKVSKQSQNRNHHHQNQHQTQYRNHKKR
jgi:hypothetical protein